MGKNVLFNEFLFESRHNVTQNHPVFQTTCLAVFNHLTKIKHFNWPFPLHHNDITIKIQAKHTA